MSCGDGGEYRYSEGSILWSTKRERRRKQKVKEQNIYIYERRGWISRGKEEERERRYR